MRHAAIAGLLASLALLAGAGAALRAAGPSAAAVETRTPIALRSELPAWLAPGAPLLVHGFAGREEAVELLVGGRRVARATSGPHGGFRLVARAPEPGRYSVRVRAGGREERAGVLLVRPVRLAAVGDVMFSESVGLALSDRGAAFPWAEAGALLRGADVATANLETAVSTRGAPLQGKEYVFRGPPDALGATARVGGIDVVSVANNHTLDYGREAFLDTLRHARAAGIEPVGGGANAALARRPAVVEAGGLRIAFLAYSDVNPLGFPAGPSSPGTARAVPEHVGVDVRAARRRAEVVVCWFHWGVELRTQPTAGQERLAAAALNAGAHVVLGAHPHVLGPVSVPRRGSLVAWSLGNFVFPSFREETVRTAVLIVRLDAGGVRGHDLVPHRIEGFRPVPAATRGGGS